MREGKRDGGKTARRPEARRARGHQLTHQRLSEAKPTGVNLDREVRTGRV